MINKGVDVFVINGEFIMNLKYYFICVVLGFSFESFGII